MGGFLLIYKSGCLSVVVFRIVDGDLGHLIGSVVEHIPHQVVNPSIKGHHLQYPKRTADKWLDPEEFRAVQ